MAGQKPPTAAKMAPQEILITMEQMTEDAPSILFRCWAGTHAVMGHGVLRWSDLQHSRDVHLTEDALVGTTWKMKQKKVQVQWAALRLGLSGRDWGAAWVAAMQQAGLPREDYVILAPDRQWSHFKS